MATQMDEDVLVLNGRALMRAIEMAHHSHGPYEGDRPVLTECQGYPCRDLLPEMRQAIVATAEMRMAAPVTDQGGSRNREGVVSGD